MGTLPQEGNMFSVTSGPSPDFPTALPKKELGNENSRAGGDVLGLRGEALQSPEESWAEVLPTGNNIEESTSHPFH